MKTIWLGCERYNYNKIEDGGTQKLSHFIPSGKAHYLLLDDKPVMVSKKDYTEVMEELN